ncbi:MAG: response regulator transcription factor [Geobacteraceae bacterium]|nr:response regulator transcription factor [Geobacteraceae bacterium]
MPIRVLIADDHSVVREGLRMIIDGFDGMTVVGEAIDGKEAIKMHEQLSPDVIIMDISMPMLNGIEATRIICKRNHDVKIVILSMHLSREYVANAISAGARSYLSKESSGVWVIKAIQAVTKGQFYFGPGIKAPPDFTLKKKQVNLKIPLEILSQREREVLQLVVEGKTSRQVAEILFLSPKSIETYRSRLMNKLGVNSFSSLVKFAVSHGVTPPT